MLALVSGLLMSLALAGCYSGGQSAARGAFDEGRAAVADAKTWWAEEGKDDAKALAVEASSAAIDAAHAAFQKKVEEARDKLQAEWKGRMDELQRKVKEGTASPLEIALWVLLGGGGAGTTAKLLERLLIGKRAGPAKEA